MMPNGPSSSTDFSAAENRRLRRAHQHELKGEHLAFQLRHSDARILLIHHSLLPEYEKIRADAPNLKHVLVVCARPRPDMPRRPGQSRSSRCCKLKNPSNRDPAQPRRHLPAHVYLRHHRPGQGRGLSLRPDRLNGIGMLAKGFYKPEDTLYTCLPCST